MKLKIDANVFYTRENGEIVEVWLGPCGEPESEIVLQINRFYIQNLIYVLRGYEKRTNWKG